MAKETNDFSKYFDFSGAKVISEDPSGKTIRLNGRDIHIVSEPDYRLEKERGKEEIQVHYENAVPNELRTLGLGKKYLIYTYGCPC
jgi:tRNA-2-methylthio-N6-dimethylallyladenosine synthase